MKIGKCRNKNKGEFLRMRNFAFPINRGKIERQEPVKVESFNSVKRSSSVVKLTRIVSLSQIISVYQEKPCKSFKLIKPVSVSFFNSQFDKKRREIRSASGDRKTSKKFEHLLRMSTKRQKPEFSVQVEGKLFEQDSTFQTSLEIPTETKKAKIRVQAWIPQAIIYTN